MDSSREVGSSRMRHFQDAGTLEKEGLLGSLWPSGDTLWGFGACFSFVFLCSAVLKVPLKSWAPSAVRCQRPAQRADVGLAQSREP